MWFSGPPPFPCPPTPPHPSDNVCVLFVHLKDTSCFRKVSRFDNCVCRATLPKFPFVVNAIQAYSSIAVHIHYNSCSFILTNATHPHHYYSCSAFIQKDSFRKMARLDSCTVFTPPPASAPPFLASPPLLHHLCFRLLFMCHMMFLGNNKLSQAWSAFLCFWDLK